MTKKRVRKAQKRIPLEEAMMTLPDLHAERDLLQARFVQSTRQLSALYTGLVGTPERPIALMVGPYDKIPRQRGFTMNGLLSSLQMQYEGSRELAETDAEIVQKFANFALLRPGTEIYEGTRAEIVSLLSARAFMWAEQGKMIAIIEPGLAQHGFSLQAPAPPAADADADADADSNTT